MNLSRLEFERRFERLRGRMRQRGIDAVLLGTGTSLRYFSGYPSPAINVVRPFFVFLPLAADACFITHTAHAYEAQRYSWISDVRVYQALSACPVSSLSDAIRETGAKRIGLELGFEQTCTLSPAEFERLKEALRNVSCIDISSDLWALRMIKSEAEIACMREACRITTEAYTASLNAVRESCLERDIYNRMRQTLISGGCGDTFLVITSGKGNYDLVTKSPEPRRIVAGDMVWMDAGCTVEGYWSDFSRAATAVEPTSDQQRAQQAIRAITQATIEKIRPGTPARELAQFALRQIGQLPFPITSNIAALAARIGHGVGLNLTEPPHLSLHDETVLQPGMVLSVEPGVATDYGTFHIEENVLVTPDGYEILSDCSRCLTHSTCSIGS